MHLCANNCCLQARERLDIVAMAEMVGRLHCSCLQAFMLTLPTIYLFVIITIAPFGL
jgi:hypothetical protein